MTVNNEMESMLKEVAGAYPGIDLYSYVLQVMSASRLQLNDNTVQHNRNFISTELCAHYGACVGHKGRHPDYIIQKYTAM
jgi:hypothetical protein